MNPLIQLKKRLLYFSSGWGFTCFGLSHSLQAVVPAPDGGYAGSNTAEGANALFTLTTGVWNTAIGVYALFSDTTGASTRRLVTNAPHQHHRQLQHGHWRPSAFRNTTGVLNTANGAHALYGNTAGSYNTATGFDALAYNTTGSYNTATGLQALFSNTDWHLQHGHRLWCAL